MWCSFNFQYYGILRDIRLTFVWFYYYTNYDILDLLNSLAKIFFDSWYLYVLISVSKRTSARPFVASCLAYSTFRDDVFMLGGQDAVVVWKFNEDSRKLSQTSVTLGKVKRSITNLLVSTVEVNEIYLWYFS